MRRALKCGAVAIIAIGVIGGVREIVDNPRVCRFVSYYKATQNTDAPINVWERLVYSFVLAKERSEAPVFSNVATCASRQAAGQPGGAPVLLPSQSNRA